MDGEQKALHKLLFSDLAVRRRSRLRDVDIAWLQNCRAGPSFVRGEFKFQVHVLIEVEHSTLWSGSSVLRFLDVCTELCQPGLTCLFIFRDKDALAVENLMRPEGAWRQTLRLIEEKNCQWAVIWESQLYVGHELISGNDLQMSALALSTSSQASAMLCSAAPAIILSEGSSGKALIPNEHLARRLIPPGFGRPTTASDGRLGGRGGPPRRSWSWTRGGCCGAPRDAGDAARACGRPLRLLEPRGPAWSLLAAGTVQRAIRDPQRCRRITRTSTKKLYGGNDGSAAFDYIYLSAVIGGPAEQNEVRLSERD